MRRHLPFTALLAALVFATTPSFAATGDGWQTVTGVQQISEDTLFSPHGC